MTVTRTEPMPKPREGDASQSKETTSVKMERELHRKARMIALHKDMDLFDLLDSVLRPVIEKEYRQLFRGGGQ